MLSIPPLLASLPLAKHRQAIEARIAQQRNIILTAPTGTGKSSFLPWLLQQESPDCKVVVLQPRRIAALGLSQFLAKCLQSPVGEFVGYGVRFENKQSDSTRISFQTYGHFLQSILHKKSTKPHWILFDEYHERKAEMDLLLSWLLAWQTMDSNAPRIAILSAELNRSFLEAKLQVPCLPIDDPGFPVQIMQQETRMGESLPAQVLRAYRTLHLHGIRHTFLVFLPGKGEIQATKEHLLDHLKGEESPQICSLYGGLDLEEQALVFADSPHHRVILATNIAETSLTIPQVTAVIDSGFERTNEYDHARQLPTLRLSRITMQNAIQRTGRAGRTRPGVCIRLWNEKEHQALPKEIIPEITHMRLHRFALLRAALAHQISLSVDSLLWITHPPLQPWNDSLKDLIDANLITTQGDITPLGSQVLSVPVESPWVAKFLLSTNSITNLHLSIATWIDSGNEASSQFKDSMNMAKLAEDILSTKRGHSNELIMQLQRLMDWNRKNSQSETTRGDIMKITGELLQYFPQSLATSSESGKAYRFQDGTSILLDGSHTQNSPAVLAFHLMRSSNGRLQQISRCLFLPVSTELLHQGASVEEIWQLQWKASQERFYCISIQMQNGKELGRKEYAHSDLPIQSRKSIESLCTSAWLDKHQRENLTHLWMSDSNIHLLNKMKWAAQSFPDFNFPTWSDEDWALILSEFTDGVFLQKELNPDKMRHLLEDYFGTHMLNWLHKTFPDTLRMPNGRIGKYIYSTPESGPIEISARVSDFFGMQGKHRIAESRVEVRYDLLAPNYRTVQKTWDLTGFWQNTYPEVRKELRGRYPKHPWPENPGEKIDT